MKVRNLKPQPIVAAYVERILVIEHDEVVSPFGLPLFANGTPTLVFKTVKGRIAGSRTTHLTLFGQTVIPEMLTFNEDFTLIAYFFKPFSLLSLFGVMAKELTDSPVDLHALNPKKTLGLQEMLLNTETTNGMLGLLDHYISGLINRATVGATGIQYATTRIAGSPTKEALRLVQRDLYLTERTFQRMFENEIGIAPNLYRRVCQFNGAFQQLLSGKKQRLLDIALENGYADQSHYIRAFKEFTHVTPGQFFRPA